MNSPITIGQMTDATSIIGDMTASGARCRVQKVTSTLKMVVIASKATNTVFMLNVFSAVPSSLVLIRKTSVMRSEEKNVPAYHAPIKTSVGRLRSAKTRTRKLLIPKQTAKVPAYRKKEGGSLSFGSPFRFFFPYR